MVFCMNDHVLDGVWRFGSVSCVIVFLLLALSCSIYIVYWHIPIG